MSTEAPAWWLADLERHNKALRERPTVAEIVDEGITPTIVVTSRGHVQLSGLEAAAREAWTIPGPLQVLSTTEAQPDEFVTVFAPLLTEPCS